MKKKPTSVFNYEPIPTSTPSPNDGSAASPEANARTPRGASVVIRGITSETKRLFEGQPSPTSPSIPTGNPTDDQAVSVQSTSKDEPSSPGSKKPSKRLERSKPVIGRPAKLNLSVTTIPESSDPLPESSPNTYSPKTNGFHQDPKNGQLQTKGSPSPLQQFSTTTTNEQATGRANHQLKSPVALTNNPNSQEGSPNQERRYVCSTSSPGTYPAVDPLLKTANPDVQDPSRSIPIVRSYADQEDDAYQRYIRSKFHPSFAAKGTAAERRAIFEGKSKSTSSSAISQEDSQKDPVEASSPLSEKKRAVSSPALVTTPFSPSTEVKHSVGMDSPKSPWMSGIGAPSFPNGIRSVSAKEGELWSILHNMGLEDDLLRRVASALDDEQVEVNSRRGGYTPLLWVCWKIHGDVTLPLLKLLIDHGADVNASENDGKSTWNALHSLCRYHTSSSLSDLVRYLLDNGIEINTKTPSGFNALHLACCYQKNDNLHGVVRLLLERGIDVDAKTNNGFTALHFLCKNYPHHDLKKIIQVMLDYKADIQAKNNEYWTALHFACRYYQNDDLIDIIRLLITDRGTETSKLLKVRNNSGQNALECCLLNPGGQFHEIFDYIKDNKQRLNFAPVWRADSLLVLANIGCIPTVKWFVQGNEGTFNVVDAHGLNCVDYLEEVYRKSLVLCRKCLTDGKSVSEIQAGLTDLRTLFALKKTFFLPFSPFIKKELEKSIPDRPDYVLSKEDFLVSFPEFDTKWQQLVHSWSSASTGKINFRAIDKYVSQNSHASCTGQSSTCAWCRVSEDVHLYLSGLIDKIRTLDPRLESEQLIGYGSAAEKSKLFIPDEFDFAVVLKHFHQSRPNSLDIWYNGPEDAEAFKKRDCTRSSISSGRLLFYFGFLMEEAIRRVPWNPHVIHPSVTINETCVTLTFYYRSNGYAGHQISVDVTLAVVAEMWGTDRFEEHGGKLPKWCPNNKQYIVPYRSGDGSLWQFSTFTIERDILLQPDCLETVTHVLRLLKALVCLNQVRPDQRSTSRKSHPTSYALKTCLYYYMMQHPPPWKKEDILVHCRGIFKSFPFTESELISFFRDKSAYHLSYMSKKVVDEIVKKLDRCYLSV